MAIFPRFATIAFDLLSIPAMIVECKRVFSQIKLAVSSQRNAINNATLEAIQYIKNWLNSGGIVI